jgi:hypothetical protein
VVQLRSWSHRYAVVQLRSWSHRYAVVQLRSWGHRYAVVQLRGWSHRYAVVQLRSWSHRYAVVQLRSWLEFGHFIVDLLIAVVAQPRSGHLSIVCAAGFARDRVAVTYELPDNQSDAAAIE